MARRLPIVVLAVLAVAATSSAFALRSAETRRGFFPSRSPCTVDTRGCDVPDPTGRLDLGERVALELTGAWLGSIASLPDGAVLLGLDFGVLKLRSDGSVDRSFGQRGVARLPSGLTEAIAVDSRGRIVVAGFRLVGRRPMRLTAVGNGGFAITRLRADGHVDPTFGEHGVATLDPTPEQESACCVWVDELDQVIVAGHLPYPSDNALVARFRTDGRLDARYGKGGMAQVDMDFFETALRDSSGRLVLSGWQPRDLSETPPLRPSRTVRLLPGGTPDLSFGIEGRIDSEDPLSVLAVLPDGDALAIRGQWVGPTYHTTKSWLVRLRPSGDVVQLAGGADGDFRGGPGLLDPAGRLVVLSSRRFDASVSRYDIPGVRDASVGALHDDFDKARNIELVVDHRGGIVVAGVLELDFFDPWGPNRLVLQRID